MGAQISKTADEQRLASSDNLNEKSQVTAYNDASNKTTDNHASPPAKAPTREVGNSLMLDDLVAWNDNFESVSV